MKIEDLYSLFLESKTVSTDTRNIQAGSVFFALKGDNFNGNEFAEQALNQGASLAIIDEEKYNSGSRTILVDDVLTTLQELAKFHRSQLTIPVIAITGSNGKTTTKELIHSVLSTQYSVAYTKGNLNNHIGVPLTLLEVSQKHQIALIEMGDNHPKEVELLCEIAQPNFGFVTNVGKDHLEGFGSFENNILAKKEVFDYLEKVNGTVFLDVSDSVVSSMVAESLKVISYGEFGSNSFIKFKESNPLVVFIDELNTEVETNLFGAFNFNNIQLAYCIGKYFDVSLTDVSSALAEYKPDNNRSQVLRTERNTLIMDAYNANPSSVEEAVNSFCKMKTDKSKIVILGDMFELGRYSEIEHQNMANLAIDSLFDEVVLIGENYAKVEGLTGVNVFKGKPEAELYIKKIAPEGAIILLKGSRGMRLESLKPLL